MALQRRHSAWPAWGVGVVREAFLEEVTSKQRTEGWIGIHHDNASREKHVKGCAQTIVIGYHIGQSLKWEGTLTLVLPTLLD